MTIMIETYYKVQIHNEKGELVKDSGLIPSRSYVIQFLELICGLLRHAYNTNEGDISATDVDNAESVLVDVSDEVGTKGRVNGGAGDDTFGIVVGINSTPTGESNTNYKLDDKIAHSGVGASGCLNYQATSFSAPAVDGANVDFDISRTFYNESGDTITVKEIGIICKNTTDTKYHLLLRDVVSDEAVLDAYTLTVTYTLRTTV